MDDLDINILVQTFSEKIGQLTTDLVIKEATIKQLNIKVANLIAAMQPGKTEKTIKQTKTDNFEWGKWNVEKNNWNKWSNWNKSASRE